MEIFNHLFNELINIIMTQISYGSTIVKINVTTTFVFGNKH